MNNGTGNYGFYLSVGPDRLARVQEVLAQEGVDFQPEMDMLALNGEAEYHDALKGSSLRYAVGEINRFLRENGHSPDLPEDLPSISMEQRRQLMQLAQEEFVWNEFTVESNRMWSFYGLTWTNVLEQYPLLAGERNPGAGTENRTASPYNE